MYLAVIFDKIGTIKKIKKMLCEVLFLKNFYKLWLLEKG